MSPLQRLLVGAIAFIVTSQVTFTPTQPDVKDWVGTSIAQAKGRSGGSSGGSSGRSSSSSSRSSSSGRSSSSSPSRNNTAPSGSKTGGRAKGGSFDRSTPQPKSSPAPASPSTSPTRPKPPAPLVPAPRPSTTHSAPHYYNYHHRPEIDIDIESNPGYQPVPNPQTAPLNPGYQPVPNPQTAPLNPGYQPVPNPQTAPLNPNVANPTLQTATSESSGFPWGFITFLLMVGGGLFLLWFILARRKGLKTTGGELDNDTLTVSKLQVAMLVQARDIQAHLTQMSQTTDLEAPEGRVELLQEAALALLRNSECWTHALSSSQTVKTREEARQLFEQISIQERSKFAIETFSHTNGHVHKLDRIASGEPNVEAEYIVVTLLVATADDNPLFGSVYSTEELKQTLHKLAAISPDYLLVLELLWSPQADMDSLSHDDLLTEYADLVQV